MVLNDGLIKMGNYIGRTTYLLLFGIMDINFGIKTETYTEKMICRQLFTQVEVKNGG